jgi:hypothetical protein
VGLMISQFTEVFHKQLKGKLWARTGEMKQSNREEVNIQRDEEKRTKNGMSKSYIHRVLNVINNFA